MIFKAKNAFNILTKKDFCNLLNINELMITKKFFLENLKEFKKLFKGKFSNIITNENTVFVSIPLISIQKIPAVRYEKFKDFFYMLFFDKLVFLAYQKKIFDPYIFNLFIESLSGKFFLIKHLYERIFNRSNLNALKTTF